MQSSISRAFYTLLASGLMVGALVGIVWLIAKALEKGATVLAASLAAMGTVGAAAIVRYYERRKEGESARRQHLGKLYEDFASAYAGEERTPRAVAKTIKDFRRKSLMYSGPGVIKAFTAWVREIPDDEENVAPDVFLKNLRNQEELIMKMRADLGTSNFGLSEGDLARAMRGDYDEWVEAIKAELEPPEPEGEEPRVTKRDPNGLVDSGADEVALKSRNS